MTNDIFGKFRVPLIIYSPLLKKSASFKGMNSHLDILPSLLGLLEGNYGLDFPAEKHWIGEGLDTAKFFNTARNFPLKLNSKTTPNYVLGNNTIYADGRVVCFDSLFTVTKETDEDKIINIKQVYQDYSYLNNHVCVRNKIWMKK